MTNPAPNIDMGELFDRDPINHTSEDIRAIIGEYRKLRVRFNQTGSTKPKKAPATPKALKGLDTNLGLDIKL